jgi:hypothetical protein
VAAEALQGGEEVVTGDAAAGSQTATKNPFLPPTIKR